MGPLKTGASAPPPLARRSGLAPALAGFFGCGRAPITPGSAGSLAALLLGWPLLLLPGWVLLLAIAAATIGGLWAIRVCEATDDPGWVVIDEVAGQWIALLGLVAPTIPGLIAAFLLFRVLDITKLGPIGWAERLPGALGVMADDLLAGVAAAAILFVLRSYWPGVFAA